MTIQTTDPLAALTGEVTPEEAAASAEAHRQAADDAAARAGEDTAEAEQIMTEARARVAEIMAEAESAAQVLTKSAAQARKQAETLTERGRAVGVAAGELARAAEAEAEAEALEAEKEQLAATATGLDDRLAELAAERGQLAAQMDAARDSGDLDALAALRSRDSAAAEVIGALTQQRDAALARLAAIGDGTETFVTRPLLTKLPPLSAARQSVWQGQQGARRALNYAMPGRPEAVEDAAREERRLTIEALSARHAEESRAASQSRRQIVYRQG